MPKKNLEIKSRFSDLEMNFYKTKGIKDNIEKNLALKKESLELNKHEFTVLDQCLQVFQTLSEMKKEEIKIKIESLVTKGLRTIFERDDYRFEIEMELKRGGMTAKPMLYSRFGNKEYGSEFMDAHGGGLIDVTSFLLQIIVLLSFNKKLDKVIIADEPFRNVSRECLPNVADFLKYLNEISGIQFIIITHKHEFLEVADCAYEVKLNSKNESEIRKIQR